MLWFYGALVSVNVPAIAIGMIWLLYASQHAVIVQLMECIQTPLNSNIHKYWNKQ